MEKLAIIGMSCIFPHSQTPEQYWQNLLAEKDLTTDVTLEEFGVDPLHFYDARIGKKDKSHCLRGGFVRDFALDYRTLPLDPEYAKRLDKIYLWTLYSAQQALQDSGYADNSALLARCGLILGNLSFPTTTSQRQYLPLYTSAVDQVLTRLLQRPIQLENVPACPQDAPLNFMGPGYPAVFVAQHLGLGGPRLTLDAACSSSLYAIKLAGHYLSAQRADLMLAGAVSAAEALYINIGFATLQAFPDDGVSRPFDKHGNGLLPAEGAGMVVLKRYTQALQDGDSIYGVVRGVGLSNDGKGTFLLNPNPKGQINCFRRAYAEAGVEPKEIDYVECHATGTGVGDVAEINSMDAFFGEYQAAPLIGSVKSNLGHMLTASGMGGLFKVIAAMQHNIIPPTLNVQQALVSTNRRFSEAQIVRKATPWPQRTGHPKLAGISAFGFGGTNAHLIVQAPHPEENPPSSYEPPPLPSLAIVGLEFIDSSATLAEKIRQADDYSRTLPYYRWNGLEQIPGFLAQHGFGPDEPRLAMYTEEYAFDCLRYKVPPQDTKNLNPQQSLILKVADQALQDANIQPGSNVAVIIGMDIERNLHRGRARYDVEWQLKKAFADSNITLSAEQFEHLLIQVKDVLSVPPEANTFTSCIGNVMSGRISSLWDFSGPAFTISTEENSVFRILEFAQLLLSVSEVEAVLVGGIDLAAGFENRYAYQQVQAEPSPWPGGDHAGAVVVKRLDTAQAAHNRIYATIDAITLQQTAQVFTPGQTYPICANTLAQTCQAALHTAKARPEDIGYIETFCSGVAIEDEARVMLVSRLFTSHAAAKATRAFKLVAKRAVSSA